MPWPWCGFILRFVLFLLIAGRCRHSLEAAGLNPAQCLSVAAFLTASVRALSNEAETLAQKGKLLAARNLLQGARLFYRLSGQRQYEGETLVRSGMLAERMGDFQEASNEYKQALNIFHALRNRTDEGQGFSFIGRADLKQGQAARARKAYRQALRIAQEIGDQKGAAYALDGLGTVDREQGQFIRALESYQHALELARNTGDRQTEGAILANLGVAYTELGQYLKAIQHYLQAQALLGHAFGGEILLSLGITYARLGKYPEALKSSQEALDIFRTVTDVKNEVKALTNIGRIYDDQGAENLASYLQALAVYRQALALQERGDGNLSDQGITLNNLGGVYARLAQAANVATYARQALDYYEQALALFRAADTPLLEAKTLNNIGEVCLYASVAEDRAAYLPRAFEALQRASDLQKQLDDQANGWITLSNLGWAYELQENWQEAFICYEQALAMMEKIVTAAGVEELKISLRTQTAATYQRAIRLLMRRNRTPEAFEFSERARARAFLDQLGNLRPDHHKTNDPALLSKAETLQLEINEFNGRCAAEQSKPVNRRNQELLRAWKARLQEKQQRYAELLLFIKANNPAYASLLQVSALKLNEVQQLLDGATSLLSYFVTPENTLVFLITRNSFRAITLPVPEHALTTAMQQFRRQKNLNNPYPQELQTLYAQLFAPLKPYLRTKTVGIIPHGVLHYLPFAALTDGKTYLGDEYALFSLPSASVLKFAPAQRKTGTPKILALANSQAAGLPPLPYSEQEVHAIARFFETDVRIGAAAAESVVKQRAGDFSMLHLAAHGELNLTSPLFSRIVLAADQANDGMLEVHEVYDLNLHQTDLVVLSACETQLGQQSRGDDIIGLNRAFLYAGAASVLASLWNVNDSATKDLMSAFYKHLQRGQSKAAALRLAQIETRAQYPQPYYWAAFVLTGDPGTTAAQTAWVLRMLMALLVGGLLLLALLKVKVRQGRPRHPPQRSGRVTLRET